MNCYKCNEQLLDGSAFCSFCGVKQQALPARRKARTRGNGQGSAYKLPNGKYRVSVTLGYDDNGRRIYKTKSGFKTKKEALAYIPTLSKLTPEINVGIKLIDLYKEWEKKHSKNITKSTIACYKCAFKYFEPLYYAKFADIKSGAIEQCIADCPQGTRTKQNMKTLGTLLYKYAMSQDIVDRNYASFVKVYTGDTSSTRDAFRPEEIEKIRSSVGTVPYADYIYVLIYTGFRLGELLALTVDSYDAEHNYLVGGSKTEAGKNRVVTLSPKIQQIVVGLVENRAGYIFTNESGSKMAVDYFRRNYYYKALKEIGVRELSPHCCRHTFATLMKNVKAPDLDKQKLIGHASIEMTAHYTHTTHEDLKKITDAL